jgi:transcription initiation factor IIE alpha subunit
MTSERRVVGVNLKLRAGAEARQSLAQLERSPDVLRIVKTFPEETDDELANLYLLEVEVTRIGPLMDRLRNDPFVEYAEQAALRKLVR